MNQTKTLPLPQQLLPHRYPFLLIDRIIEHLPGFLRAIKCVSYNEPYFQGHFAGFAIVPGVLLVEMMAQASAAVYRLDRQLQFPADKAPPEPGKLAALEKVRFFQEVHPGDKLVIEVRLRQRLGGLAKFGADIQASGNLVAESVLMLVSPLDKLPSKSVRPIHPNKDQ